MKLLNAKNFSSTISFIFHLLIFLIIISSFHNKIENQTPKYVEIGFAGTVESNSPGSPGSRIINGSKIIKLQKNNKKNLKNEIKKPIKRSEEISKKSKVEKKTKLKTASVDSAEGSDNSNQNLSTNNSNNNTENGGNGNGQNGSEPAKKGTPDQEDFYHVAVDQMPVPIGGIEEIDAKAFYPPQAKANKIEGTVYVLAYIDENGFVRKTFLIKGIGYGCDRSAMRAVKETRFSPGILHGIPVKVQLTIPVKFSLH